MTTQRSADLELTRSLLDGHFRLDGGAMFGVVPKPLWERRAPADDRNRIPLAMRPLLVRGERLHAHRRGRRRQDGRRRASTSTASIGASISTCTLAGGRRRRGGHRHRAGVAPALRSRRRLHRRATPTGALGPAFPRARYVVSARRVGGRDAPARAEPRQLPRRELRAAAARPASSTSARATTTIDARRPRAAHRRPHACTIRSSTSSRAAGPRCSPPT